MRGVVEFGWEGMQIDIPVGTVGGAKAAADAPVFDDYLERVAPPDGADRASDHAERIATLTAGSGHQVLVEAQTFADQAADSLMGIGTGANALVAARAFLQVKHEKALRLHQSLRQELIHWNVLRLNGVPQIFFDTLVGNCLQLLTHLGKAIEHELKIFTGDAHDLYMV